MKRWLLVATAGLLLGACGADTEETSAPESDAKVEVAAEKSGGQKPETEDKSTETQNAADHYSEEKEVDETVQIPVTYESQENLTENTENEQAEDERAALAEEAARPEEAAEEKPVETVEESAPEPDAAVTDLVVQPEVQVEQPETEKELPQSEEKSAEAKPAAPQPEVNKVPAAQAKTAEEVSEPEPELKPVPATPVQKEEKPVVELENYALEQVTARTGLLSEKYTYFADMQENNWVQVEIRETATDGIVEWTSLIGIYRYNVETEQMETLSTAGEFE